MTSILWVLMVSGHEDDFTAHVGSWWEMNTELEKRKENK